LCLEMVTMAAFLVRGQPKRAVAVMKGLAGALFMWKIILKGRRIVQSIRCVPEAVLLHRMYRGSAALAYYLQGKRHAGDLLP
jgi:hypothetical protein